MRKLNSRHHLLFPAAEWTLRPEAAVLRETPSLIPRMSRLDHNYIHQLAPIVPVLGYHTLMTAARLFDPRNETMRDIDGICSAIGKAAAHEKSHRIETELAGLTIEALQLQKTALRAINFTTLPYGQD